MYSQAKRIEFLDSIRGLAALFVLLGHSSGAFAFPASYFAMANWPFFSILFSGSAAVAMFFVLSGYVLSKPYVETGPDTRRIFLPTFYLRRFIRIWLPWFFAFIISIVAKKLLFFQPVTQPSVTGWLHQFWQAKLTVPDFFRQCAFALHDASRLLLSQDWTLGVELKGSALVPLFVVCARRKNVAVLFPLAVLLFILFSTGEYYVSFIVGVLMAQYDSSGAAWLARLGRPLRWSVFGGSLLLYQGWDFARCLFHHWPVAAYRYGWLVATVGCAGILISVFGSQTLQRTLNYRPIVLLGRISYSVYLLQFIIILCLLPPLVAMFNQLGVTQPLVLCPVTMLASVAATIGCATIMYRFVEFRSFSSATGSPRQSSCDSKSKGKPCVNLKVGTARCAGKKNG